MHGYEFKYRRVVIDCKLNNSVHNIFNGSILRTSVLCTYAFFFNIPDMIHKKSYIYENNMQIAKKQKIIIINKNYKVVLKISLNVYPSNCKLHNNMVTFENYNSL